LFKDICSIKAENAPLWSKVKLVLQVHDELVVEAPEAIGEAVKVELQYAMEHATELPGVKLIAKPVIAKRLSDLK
jgi:DNA polymerase I-like protein with 3'-5' exonuclease and polymerase domains